LKTKKDRADPLFFGPDPTRLKKIVGLSCLLAIKKPRGKNVSE